MAGELIELAENNGTLGNVAFGAKKCRFLYAFE